MRGEYGIWDIIRGDAEARLLAARVVLPWVAKPYPDRHGVSFRVCRFFTMAAMTFDTHAAIKAIKDAGAAEPLAEAIVSAIQTGTAHLNDLATKTDLDSLATKADLELLELRMTMRLGLTALVLIVLALAAAKFL